MKKDFTELGKLNQLEGLVRESLQRVQPKPIAAAPSLPQSQAASPTAASKALPSYSTAREEYRAALGDPELIEALLRLRKTAPPQKKTAPAQNPAKPGAAAPPSPFSPHKPSRTEAEIKPAPLGKRGRSTPSSGRVFRGKYEL